jgi:hypothetical protein
MAASRDECVAAMPRQQYCIDRTYARAMAWAAYTAALPMPPTDTAPETIWVKQRILADRFPGQGQIYAQQITPYLLEIPNITSRIREHLNNWNDEETEDSLSVDIDGALAVIMPKYASAAISDQDVANWCDKHGYPRPDDLIGVFLPTPPIPPSA